MKRKFLTALVIAGGLFLTACQEDSAMEEMDQLIQDTELQALGGEGDDDDDTTPPPPPTGN